MSEELKAKSFVGEDQEKSTARTEARASNPLPEWMDLDQIRTAFGFLGIHHAKARDEAARDALNTDFGPIVRAKCKRVSNHHQEELYKLGEQCALFGFRNPWPRP